MAGLWKITLTASGNGGGGSGNALWWEDSATVETDLEDFSFGALNLTQDADARNQFLADAIDARDDWQDDQTQQAVADALAVTWAEVINNNDEQVT